MQKEDKKYLKELKAYTIKAETREKYSIERFDILIISLSSGGIALCMSFFENFKEIDKLQVYNACIYFAVALVINLISQLTGYYANKYDIKYIKEEIRELEKKDFKSNYKIYDCYQNIFDKLTKLFNMISLLCFIIGIIFLIIFINQKL